MDEKDRDEEVECAMKDDVFSFASIMLDILVGRDEVPESLPFSDEENEKMKNGEHRMIPEFVPRFVRDLIENGWSQDRSVRRSFEDMINVMSDNTFDFAEGVDNCEVLSFIDSVEESSL
jgi:hypothetical protein